MVTHVNAEVRGDERGALLSFLDEQRGGIRRALLGLTDGQAAMTPSVSTLSLSGLLKHVAETEQTWVALARRVAPDIQRDESNWSDGFRLVGDETVEETLLHWEKVARGTEEFVRSVPSLDDTFPLPDQPWFPDGECVSMRWLVLNLIREAARHAGHADIIRESLDGKTAFELVAMARE
ncbi:DinB family protein [Streptomyces sp. NPDC005356]|uniref:DinB family protein n=1 Tax=unclassified Streptomyces TaxID=2593676 RepID=UPI0033BE00BD